MSGTPQPPAPGPKPAAPTSARATSGQWFLPWWLPGLALGLIAALGALAVVMVRPMAPGTHKAEALLQLRPNEPEEKRQQRIALLRSRDLIASVLQEPAVAALPTVRLVDTPIEHFGGKLAATIDDVESRLTVAEISPDVVSVSMTGYDPDDIKVILEHLVRYYIDNATAHERATLDTQIKKNEQYAEQLRIEIEAMEKQIELLQKANSTTGGGDNAKRLALLQTRLIDTDTEFNRTNREIGKLEAELTVLKKQLDDKNPKIPPDPVLVEEAVKKDPRVIKAKAALDATVEAKAELDKARKEYDEARKTATAEAVEIARALENAQKKGRIADLETQIEIKKVEREKLRNERDSLRKMIDQGIVGGGAVESMRKALQPQRETLDKLNTLLARLRVERAMDTRVSLRGEVAVEQLPGPERTSLLLWPGVAFVAGFVLATVFSLVGLLFRVLRRAA